MSRLVPPSLRELAQKFRSLRELAQKFRSLRELAWSSFPTVWPR